MINSGGETGFVVIVVIVAKILLSNSEFLLGGSVQPGFILGLNALGFYMAAVARPTDRVLVSYCKLTLRGGFMLGV